MDHHSEIQSGLVNVMHYLRQVHDIYLPQQLFDFACDEALHESYRLAITEAVQKQKDTHVLAIGRGAVLYAMMAAKAGAVSVSVIEPWQYLCHLYKDILKANDLAEQIRIHQCSFQELKWNTQYGVAPNLFISDTFGPGLLDKGIIDNICYAQKNILADDHIILPQGAKLYVTPIELRTGDINGFDLSLFNRYRQAAAIEPVILGEEPFNVLADTVTAFDLNFQSPDAINHNFITFKARQSGYFNVLALWYDLYLNDEITVSTSIDGKHGPIRHQGIGYLVEGIPVKARDRIEVKVSYNHDKYNLKVVAPVVSEVTAVSLRPAVPHWHFPMLADEKRNNAYQDAIEKAIAKVSEAKVLDIGAGTGLLAMIAKRAGATKVTACEMIPHIADLAREILQQNGFGNTVQLISKWSESIEIPQDMEEKANLLVSETVDHSLLGENFLSTLNHARKHLLTAQPVIIPAAATVYAAGIQLRVDQVRGYDLRMINLLRSQHYTSFQLHKTPYKQLTRITEIFHFDFYQAVFEPQSKFMELEVQAAGTCNAIAFWYDLYLDDEVIINTGPASDITAWQQAVIFFDHEVQLEKGGHLPISCSYDLHSIQLQLNQLECVLGGLPLSPLLKPDWYDAFSGTEKLMSKNTEKVIALLKGLSPEVVKSIFEEILNQAGSHDLDPMIISDFIIQYNLR